MDINTIYEGDALRVLCTLPSSSVHCVVTSPPYWRLRDYNNPEQLGQEVDPFEYVRNLVRVFREVRRVLAPTGTCWLNLGDCYAGKAYGTIKANDLVGAPWMAAFALRDDGWYLRTDVVWAKSNVMPEPVKNRMVRNHEFLFLLTKRSKGYQYDVKAAQEPLAPGSAGRYKYAFGGKKNEELRDTVKPTAIVGHREVPAGRNRRTVWTTTVGRTKDAHFAVMSEAVVEPCILLGSKTGDVVLDPFMGSGTTARVARRLGRSYVGIEMNPDYVAMANASLGVNERAEIAV